MTHEENRRKLFHDLDDILLGEVPPTWECRFIRCIIRNAPQVGAALDRYAREPLHGQ